MWDGLNVIQNLQTSCQYFSMGNWRETTISYNKKSTHHDLSTFFMLGIYFFVLLITFFGHFSDVDICGWVWGVIVYVNSTHNQISSNLSVPGLVSNMLVHLDFE